MEKKNNSEKPIPYTSKPTRITPNPYKEIAEIKDGKHRFSFGACKDWLENLGKRTYGDSFRLYPDDFPLIYSLIVYAIEDKKEAEKCNLNLKKGILLTGPIGCGKTTLMNLVKYFFQPGKQYQVKSTRDITFEFEQEGYKVINRYSKNPLNLSYTNPVPNIFCFDDLGIEQTQKHFGNECNVMAEILLSRYDLFISKGIPTHLTSNLSASEIEEKYGNRVRSRMREMFNLVAFDKESGDKRS
ncbi:ATPase [Maribellus comscasis]|uniref:ATPase n=1 Tax=Maribellus comscasis TaxID=2681766 RepID=UPI001FE2B2D1|nr:ATPase [Maribellus comscasis]